MRNSLTDFVVAAILGVAIILLFRVEDEDEDPGWEARWRSLSAADRSRIRAAARSGALLADPDEIELAAGFARRDRHRLGPVDLMAIGFVVIGAALVVAGVAADSIVFTVGGGLFLLRGLWFFQQDRQVARNLREAISRDHRP